MHSPKFPPNLQPARDHPYLNLFIQATALSIEIDLTPHDEYVVWDTRCRVKGLRIIGDNSFRGLRLVGSQTHADYPHLWKLKHGLQIRGSRCQKEGAS